MSTLSTVYQSRRAESGFSLLELVVAVSIMLILGVVGTVGYQTYTDNARQAALDTSASDVMTAVIAEDSVPNGDVEAAVKNFNETSENITVDIRSATAQGMTIEATTCDGGSGTATVKGNHNHIDKTTFRDVQYDWTGDPHESTSTKTVCGEVIATNHATNPVNAVNLGWSNNVNRSFVKSDATFNDHPLGITTGVQSRSSDEVSSIYSMSLYNLGGTFMEDTDFYTGVWVKTDTPGQAAVGFSEKYVDIPVNEWFYLVSDTKKSSIHPGVTIRHNSVAEAANATSWTTGAIITYDEPPTEYFDGDTQ